MTSADLKTSRIVPLPLEKLAAVGSRPEAKFDEQRLLIPFFNTHYSKEH
jgi:hypothetical protein